MYSIVLRYQNILKGQTIYIYKRKIQTLMFLLVWWKRKWVNTMQSDVNHLFWKLRQDFFLDFKIEQLI